MRNCNHKLCRFLEGVFGKKAQVTETVVRRSIRKGKKMKRFDVVKLDREASAAKKEAKALFVSLEKVIKDKFPSGVSRNQALLRLEEAYNWVAKSARVATSERASV